MSKFKAGDLAIIVGVHTKTENLGRVVELVERLLPGQSFRRPDGVMTKLNENSPSPGWLVVADDLVSSQGHKGFASVDERHLMPLKGDFQPEQQKAKEEEPCH